jgi:hypothetical protein
VGAHEAELMDAQQRLLLELAYQALHQAGGGRVPGATGEARAQACVAVGIASAEYNNHVLRRLGAPVSAYSATGGVLSVASGRLAFAFGLRGPAVSVDTACSSSLVGHLAAGCCWYHLSARLGWWPSMSAGACSLAACSCLASLRSVEGQEQRSREGVADIRRWLLPLRPAGGHPLRGHHHAGRRLGLGPDRRRGAHP